MWLFLCAFVSWTWIVWVRVVVCECYAMSWTHLSSIILLSCALCELWQNKTEHTAAIIYVSCIVEDRLGISTCLLVAESQLICLSLVSANRLDDSEQMFNTNISTFIREHWTRTVKLYSLAGDGCCHKTFIRKCYRWLSQAKANMQNKMRFPKFVQCFHISWLNTFVSHHTHFHVRIYIYVWTMSRQDGLWRLTMFVLFR